MGQDNELHDNFKPGDEVMCPGGHGPTIRGTVRKVTPSSVTVDKTNGHSETYRRSKWSRPFQCRKRTAADDAADVYAVDLARWKESAPAFKAVTIRIGGLQMDSVRVSFDAVGLTEPSDLDAIDSDMAALREWLSKRPVEPSEAP